MWYESYFRGGHTMRPPNVQKIIDRLQDQVNKLIQSCYYRTKSGKIQWRQGRYFGTSTASETAPMAYLQAMEAIRHNAGIDEINLASIHWQQTI